MNRRSVSVPKRILLLSTCLMVAALLIGAGLLMRSDSASASTSETLNPDLQWLVSPSHISEDGGVSAVTVTLDNAAASDIVITVSAAAVSPAVAGDFTLSANTTLTIAKGATTSTGEVTITAIDNSTFASNKAVTVSGAVSSGATASSSATLTIVEDDYSCAGTTAVATEVAAIKADSSLTADQKTAREAGTVADCEALLASRDVLRGAASLNWSASVAINDWNGVTVAAGRVSKLRRRNTQAHRRRDTGATGRPVESGSAVPVRQPVERRDTRRTRRPVESDLWLDLFKNRLSGEIPEELGDLSNLAVLSLSDNRLSGEIPEELGDLSNLTGLSLFKNRLSGEIPEELGDLSNLTGLSLLDNRLSGEIPEELGDLSNLTWLWLYDNQLSGEIPEELGDLSNLTGLSLSDNRLSGEIPEELGGLSNLTLLDLSDNQLSGEIPEELGDLTNLRRLWLHTNNLNGLIPLELDKLHRNLTSLKLHENKNLRGCIPDVLWNAVQEVIVDPIVKRCSLAPPQVSAMDITSSPAPGQNDYYKIGDAIVATATFSRAVKVVGTPTLIIDIGGEDKTATCAAKPGDNAKLECAYTVAAGDEDADGIQVDANGLTGTITSTGAGGGSEPATLSHSAIDKQVGHKVDGVVPAKPTGFTAVSTGKSGEVDLRWSDPGDAKISKWQYAAYATNEDLVRFGTPVRYALRGDDRIQVTATNSYTLYVPHASAKFVGSKSLRAAELIFPYMVVEEMRDGSWMYLTTVAMPAVGPGITKFQITPKLYISINRQTVGGVANIHVADIKVVGDNGMTLRLSFAQELQDVATWKDVPGSSATTTEHLVSGLWKRKPHIFMIRAVDQATNAGPASEPQETTTVGATSAAVSLVITSSPPAGQNNTYKIGDDIVFTVDSYRQINQINVLGTPTLTIDIGGEDRAATCAAKLGETVKLECRYTVAVGDEDTDGISVARGSVNGTFTEGDGTRLILDNPTIDRQVDHKVDGVVPAKPTGFTAFSTGKPVEVELRWGDPDDAKISKWQYTIDGGTTWNDVPGSSATTVKYVVSGLEYSQFYTFKIRAVDQATNAGPASEPQELRTVSATSVGVSLVITSSPPAGQNNTYKIGDDIVFTVDSRRQINVLGTPTLTIDIGGEDRAATCAAKLGEIVKLECKYTVAVGDEDTDGISVARGSVKGNFTITEGDGTYLILDNPTIDRQVGHKVYGVVPGQTHGLHRRFHREGRGSRAQVERPRRRQNLQMAVHHRR